MVTACFYYTAIPAGDLGVLGGAALVYLSHSLDCGNHYALPNCMLDSILVVLTPPLLELTYHLSETGIANMDRHMCSYT